MSGFCENAAIMKKENLIRILLVEDDLKLADLIFRGLDRGGTKSIMHPMERWGWRWP